MPVVLTILGDIFTLEERARIQGWFSAVWGTSSLAGPAIGALLVETLGWRSIFFVNLPFGALGFGVLAWRYHDHERPHSTDLDLPGVGLLAVACTAILALVSLGLDGLSARLRDCCLAIAVVALVWFIRVERRASNPILPPSLILQSAIGPAMLGSALMGVAFFGVDTYVPLYVQGTTGAGATAAAGVVTPVMLAWATSGIFVAPIIVRWGFRRTAVVGSSLGRDQFHAAVHLRPGEGQRLGVGGRADPGRTGFWRIVDAADSAGAAQCDLAAARHCDQRHPVLPHHRRRLGIGLLGMLFNVLAAPQMQQLREMGVSPAAIMDPHKSAALPCRCAADYREHDRFRADLGVRRHGGAGGRADRGQFLYGHGRRMPERGAKWSRSRRCRGRLSKLGG